MLQIHKELEESAAMSGASWATTFRRIILPLLKPGLVAGWIYIMIVSIRELSSSILLYSPGSEVLSILIWELWENGQYVELSALGVMFIIALFFLVMIAQWVGSKFESRSTSRAQRLGLVHGVRRRARPDDPRRAGRELRGAAEALHAARAERLRQDHRCARSPGWKSRARGGRRRRPRHLLLKQGVFVPPNRRGLGMVFQSYAIWPHMTVFDNAAFPPGRQAGIQPEEIQERVMRVLKVVALDEMADREATKLSGGQQQRLALARALVMEPPLLLLDEPLSNLDAKLRERMRFELKRLQRELGITTVYVTHDQSEALALSHSIAVMNAGRIEQLGSPREVYERPRNQFVADFVGTTNFIKGDVSGADPASGFYRIRSEIGELKARGVDSLKSGEEVVLSIRPKTSSSPRAGATARTSTRPPSTRRCSSARSSTSR